MKFNKLVVLFLIATVFFGCNKDDNATAFDAAAQAVIDDETLIDYLKSHYYIQVNEGEIFGSIDTIKNGEVSLFDDEKLKTQSVTEDEISYNLYYYIQNEGSNIAPEVTDSVLVNYRGFLLDSTKFDERLSFTWLSLTSVIRGWSHGFVNFKDGNNTTAQGEPLNFSGTGDGVLFIPSGLAYGNFGSGIIGPSNPILFHIKLGLVERADHDNDGIFSNLEDLDGDLNPNNDDTDNDNFPNYLDADDDNDGRLTRNESKTNDEDNDGIVDYLDPDN